MADTINPFGGGSYTPDHLAQFLSRVVPWAKNQPPEGYVNIHYDLKDKPQYGHPGRAYASMDEYGQLQNFVGWLNRNGSNLFFCIAAVTDYVSVDQRGNRKARRKGAIALSARSFVLDLDVKRGAYASQRDALLAGLAFCDDHGLVPGFITSSGNGIHIYFVLDQAIDPDTWRPLASQLATAAQEAKLHADFKVTRNMVSLVRLPTGFNHKDPANPKECRVLQAGPDMTLAQMQAALARYPVTPGVNRPVEQRQVRLDPVIFPPRPPITYGPDFARVSADLDHSRIVTSIDLLRDACPVVADSEVRGGDGDREPLWFELAKLCHYVQNGRDYFHDLSSEDPRYDEAATDLKFDQVQKDGWPSCKAIEQTGPEASAICKRCAFYGNTQLAPKPSPIHFATRALPGTVAAAMPMQSTVSPAPAQVNGYNGHGNVAAFVSPSGAAPANPIFLSNLQSAGYALDPHNFIITPTDPKPIFRTEISNIDCVWEPTRRGPEVIRYYVTLPKGNKAQEDHVLTFTAGQLVSPSGASVLKDGGLTYETRNFPLVQKFMDDWLTSVRKQMAMKSATRLGWIHDDGGAIIGFAYGGYRFDKTGKYFLSAPSSPVLAPRGNLNDWRAAANFFIGKGCIEMEVIIATAFAAPLVCFTAVDGLIVFARADTGYGKSASLHTSASVWGSRKQVSTSATMNSVDAEIALKNNLPVYFDELAPGPKGGSNTQRFGEMVLRITSGIERKRLDRSSELQEQRESQTLLAAASNYSLTEISSGRDTSAQAARVLEIEMSTAIHKLGNLQSKTAEVKRMFELNYGQAGLVYSEYLGANHDVVEAQIQKVTDFFQKETGAGESERFWLAAAATLLVGAMISKQLGLIDFDILSMKKFLLDQLRRQRAAVKEMAVDPNDPKVQLSRVGDFINANRNWVVTETLPRHGGKHDCGLMGVYDHARTSQGFILRFAKLDKKIMISETRLKAWCVKEGIHYRDLYRTLEKNGHCQRPKSHRSLTAGTPLSAATESVLLFDLTLPCNATLLVEEDDHV